MRDVSYPLSLPYASCARILNVITDFVGVYLFQYIDNIWLKNEVHCNAAAFLATETCYHGNNYQQLGYKINGYFSPEYMCTHINREFANHSATVTLAMKCVYNVSVGTQHIVIGMSSE